MVSLKGGLWGKQAWAGILPLTRHHHERYDEVPRRANGGGDTVRGSRILAVADSLEALGSERPYRSSFEWEEIIATLKEDAGSQWGPRVIEVALRVLCRKGNI